MTTTESTTVITDRAALTITINGESLRTFWDGTMVPYAMTYLEPRHVRALGHEPRKGKTYALRGGNQLVTCHGDYTGFAARLALPALHINQADFVTTTTIWAMRITCNHSSSSYGIPVILSDGGESWLDVQARALSQASNLIPGTSKQ